MTHHARLNLIMAITIIALIVFVYLRPESDTIQEYSLSLTPMDAVQHLRIVTQQQEILLERTEGYWRLTHPFDAPVDERKIEKMLEILQAKSLHRFQREDLGRFGLNQPSLQLFVNDAYFGFGGFAPTTHQQYVATGNYVYLIPPHHALAVLAHVHDLVNSELPVPGQ